MRNLEFKYHCFIKHDLYLGDIFNSFSIDRNYRIAYLYALLNYYLNIIISFDMTCREVFNSTSINKNYHMSFRTRY